MLTDIQTDKHPDTQTYTTENNTPSLDYSAWLVMTRCCISTNAYVIRRRELHGHFVAPKPTQFQQSQIYLKLPHFRSAAATANIW